MEMIYGCEKIKYFIRLLAYYLLVCCVVIECRCMWMHMPNTIKYDDIISILTNIMLGSSIILVCTNQNSIKSIVKILMITCLLYSFGKFFLYNNNYNGERFSMLFLPLVIIIVVCGMKDCRTIFDCYVNIIFAIALVSILFWVFGSILHILPFHTSVISWGGIREIKQYFNIYFEPQTINFMNIYIGIRNTACFTEAPMASLHFSIALMLECLVKTKKNIIKIVVLCLGIITTFSTTGYLIAISVFGWIMVKKLWEDDFARKLIPIIGAFLFCIGIIILLKRINTKGTGDVRVDDFRACFLAWKTSPFWGTGYDNTNVIKSFMSDFRKNNMGLSNTIGPILAQGGLFLFAPYVWCAIKGILACISKRNWDLLVCTLLFIVLTTITIVPYQWLYFCGLVLLGKMKIDGLQLKYKVYR